MLRFKLVLIVIISLVLGGCAAGVGNPANAPDRGPPVILDKRAEDPTPEKVQLKHYAVMKVFYATDRNLGDTLDVKSYFGPDRSETVTYGTTEISIPRFHIRGRLESPSIMRLEFNENPEKHVKLMGIETKEQDQFFNDLSTKVQASGKKAAFLFIHGYNVSFEDAARRTGQLAYDLGFDGAPVFYSWPSKNEVKKYTYDQQTIWWAQTHIQNFLAEFLQKSSAENVYLIAHSMGTQALTKAYIDVVKSNPAYKARIKEVILAAPDIDADIFKRDIVPAIVETGNHVTLYASSNDIPLLASKELWGGVPRAGLAGENLIVMKGLDTIDASNVKTSFLGHSYFADSEFLLADLFHIIQNGLSPDKRWYLSEVENSNGKYWRFW